MKTDNEPQEIKDDITNSFLELDIINMSPWSVYKMGVKKGAELV